MKPEGLVGKIVVGVVIALLAGGTAPWWWNIVRPKSTPPHELTTLEKDEVWKLADILQTLADKSISRSGIVTAIRNYADARNDFTWKEVLRYLEQIDQEDERLGTVMKTSTFSNFIITKNDLYKEVAGIADEKVGLSKKVHSLANPPHTESQIAELREIAKRFEKLGPRLESASKELQNYLQQQNSAATSHAR